MTTACGAMGWGLLPVETAAAEHLDGQRAVLPRRVEDADRAKWSAESAVVVDLAAPSTRLREETLSPDLTWFAVAWLAVTSLLAIRLLASGWRLRGIVRRAMSFDVTVKQLIHLARSCEAAFGAGR
jgi:hypothetical protein